jgi:hypothetical protein
MLATIRDGVETNRETDRDREKRQRAMFAYREDEVDLMLVHGKWYLAAVCDMPEPEKTSIEKARSVVRRNSAERCGHQQTQQRLYRRNRHRRTFWSFDCLCRSTCTRDMSDWCCG